MDILYLLIPLSLAFVFFIGAVFWFALRSGQFDDLEAPAFKILLDDEASKTVADADAVKPGVDLERG